MGSKIFKHCVCKDDLKLSVDSSKNPTVSLYMYVKGFTNYNSITASLREVVSPVDSTVISTVFSQALTGNAGLNAESKTWSKNLTLPSPTPIHQVFMCLILKMDQKDIYVYLF